MSNTFTAGIDPIAIMLAAAWRVSCTENINSEVKI